jgi:hypothetical protein
LSKKGDITSMTTSRQGHPIGDLCLQTCRDADILQIGRPNRCEPNAPDTSVIPVETSRAPFAFSFTLRAISLVCSLMGGRRP